MINSFKNPAIMRILRTTERHGAGWREQNFIPDNEALGELKSRKSLVLQGFAGLRKAPKIHLYIKLTSNDAKTDAETEKSLIWVKFACSGNLIWIKDLEKRLLLKVFFCPNRSASGQDANDIIYRACQSG